MSKKKEKLTGFLINIDFLNSYLKDNVSALVSVFEPDY